MAGGSGRCFPSNLMSSRQPENFIENFVDARSLNDPVSFVQKFATEMKLCFAQSSIRLPRISRRFCDIKVKISALTILPVVFISISIGIFIITRIKLYYGRINRGKSLNGTSKYV